MNQIHIRDKLTSMGVAVDGIVMGDFDYIGEFTAKRERHPGDANYKRHGAFFRSNYERGILIYHLIRCFGVESVLEIGFGRGYATFCAAKAFHDAGVAGRITSVDPSFDDRHIAALRHVFPAEWFNYVSFVRGRSQDTVPGIQGRFDLVYIDGDHSYAATRSDWEMTRERYNKFLLFDDYHLPTKADRGTIECSRLIDEIADPSKELIIMDRRLFVDDRGVPDEGIDYGQVLLTRDGVANDAW